MSFGGAVKLTGESEYKKALSQISQNLREVSSQMKVVTSSFDKNDTSIEALSSKQSILNKKLSEQGERLKVLTNRYNEVNSQYGKNSTAQQNLNNELTEARTKLSDIEQELGTSSKEYKEQAKVVKELEGKQDAYNKAVSEANIKMNEAQAEYNKTAREVDKLGEQIKDAEKPTNDLGDSIKKSGEDAKNASNEGFTVMKGVLANLVSQGINLAINGVKKLSSVVINVGKQAVESYADFEQLKGGVETLFGTGGLSFDEWAKQNSKDLRVVTLGAREVYDALKEVEDVVLNNANNAYKTAGLSANEYMETVTSFAAALNNATGDVAVSAEYADMAIRDMADNSNKMGTAMESIQNAYQGFAKQNYTMLDNLKLGYGGTKSEMARLVKESGVLGKAGEDLTVKNFDQKVSFDTIVEAIHKVQSNMGITGTTSKEAASTISGSVNSMKAAWKNLLTAIADDNQDMSKSVDAFVDSAITASNNLVPRIKKSVEGIRTLVNNVINEVFPKLKRQVPELKPLIETFEWFIKNKSLVVNAVKLMIAAFAVSKINKWTKSMSDVVTSFLGVIANAKLAAAAVNTNTVAQTANTTAQVAGTTATKGLTVATTLLNQAWKSNPIGLVVTAAMALYAIYQKIKGKSEELTEAQKQQSEEIESLTSKIHEEKEAWNELVESQQEQINVGMTELNHYGNLYDELTRITDANGKVKKGYEERASFIVSTLNNALGTEIRMTNGVIQEYSTLKDTIQKVMEKKKAEILLSAQEEAYTEAIKNRGEAVKQYLDLQQQLQDKESEYHSLQGQWLASEMNAQKLRNEGHYIRAAQAQKEADDISNNMNLVKEQVDNLKTAYDEQESKVKEYYYNIALYENNAALAHAEQYDKMSDVTYELVKDYETADEKQKKLLEDKISWTETGLDFLKELEKETGLDIFNQRISDDKKLLEQQKKDLKQYTAATEAELNNVELAWSDSLDEQLSDIVGANVEFREDGKGNVTAYVDGVKISEPKSKKEMAKLINDTIKEITSQNDDAKKAGEGLIDGINKGIKNQNKQSLVFSSISGFGKTLLSKLRSSLKEKSPSKATNEMGQFLLEGLGLGIKKEENSIFKQISNFGRNTLNAFRSSLNGGVRFGADLSGIANEAQSLMNNNYSLSRSLSNTNAINNDNAYRNMVEGFKEALAEMKIEMDDEQLGRFVSKTVADEVYS